MTTVTAPVAPQPTAEVEANAAAQASEVPKRQQTMTELYLEDALRRDAQLTNAFRRALAL